ncbi:hypothetical protein G6F24_015914 [Rhizopus arrhizus]|nr:hypothetical protein G6F24_015914 [Rhizopus arrhizus]
MAAGAGTVGVAGAGARAAALGHHRAAVDRAADVAGIVAAGNAVAEPDRWRGRRADRRHPTLWYSRGVAVVAAVRAGAGVRRGQPGGSRTRTGSGRCAADAGRRPAGRAGAGSAGHRRCNTHFSELTELRANPPLLDSRHA